MSGTFDSAGAGDKSGWKKEMRTKLSVLEISPSMAAAEAAAVIQQHRVLVLVNLNGWTLNDRNDIFALQPSAVQVCFPPLSFFPSSSPCHPAPRCVPALNRLPPRAQSSASPRSTACFPALNRRCRWDGWATLRLPAAAT